MFKAVLETMKKCELRLTNLLEEMKVARDNLNIHKTEQTSQNQNTNADEGDEDISSQRDQEELEMNSFEAEEDVSRELSPVDSGTSFYEDDIDQDESEDVEFSDLGDELSSVESDPIQASDVGVILQQHDINKETRQELCNICLSELGFHSIVKLGCRHLYHVECINPWISNTPRCPTCKADLHEYL